MRHDVALYATFVSTFLQAESVMGQYFMDID